MPCTSVLRAQREPALVEPVGDVLQRGLAEVRDREQVRGRAVDELGDRVDAAALEAVARALGEAQLLDAVVELGARARRGADVAELEARGLLVERRDEVEEAAQRRPRRGERLARRDRAVGLDLEDQLVEVRRLLDADRLDRERDAADRREHRVERDRADRAGALVALRAHVALAALDGDVEGEVALGVERRDAQVAVQDLDVARGLEVRRECVAGAALVEADDDGLVAVDLQDHVLQVQEDVGDVLLHPLDRRELVQGGVEADLGGRGPRDRREQRAAQRVAERVAEARVERADGEGLAVLLLLADGLDGGALDDEHVRGSSGWAGRLLGVQLDDELLVDGLVDLLAQRDARGPSSGSRPRRPRATAGTWRSSVSRLRRTWKFSRVEALSDDDVARAGPVARDRDALPVDLDVAVADELARLGPARAPARAVRDVVEAQLEELEEVRARDAGLVVGLLVEVAELLLEQPVDAARLLLLAQLAEVLGALAHAVAAVLAGRVRPRSGGR